MEKIYLQNVVGILKELADKDYQTRVWVHGEIESGMTISFVEGANMLFDDSIVSYLLENDEIILDRRVTKALQELSNAFDKVDEYESGTNKFRAEQEIVEDLAMETVRQRALETLRLIEASNHSESTVRIAVPGEE